MSLAIHRGRGLVAVWGRDSKIFLNGLVTARIPEADAEGRYCAFLNAQGRILHDAFIYPTTGSASFQRYFDISGTQDPSFMIEVDANHTTLLAQHLAKFKLRSRIQLKPLQSSEWTVCVGKTGDEPYEIGCEDTRAPGMGVRRVLPASAAENLSEADMQAYRLRRYMLGVPEGQAEMPMGVALPQEYCVDYMGGVDFAKGCYIGQELTVRTHHTGVVRRRVTPIQLFTPSCPEPESLQVDNSTVLAESVNNGADFTDPNATRAPRRAPGRFIAGVGNIGLASMQLDKLDVRLRVANGDVYVKAFKPTWWPE